MKFEWDHYSDQPAIITDKALKKRIARSVRWQSMRMLVTAILVYPLAYVLFLLFPAKKKLVDTNRFFGMSVNLDKNPEKTRQLIDELGVNNLLIRLPLSDIDNLSSYVDFAEKFKGKKLLINILQDRRHVTDLALLEGSLTKVFAQFGHLTHRFQIANAINRKKWAIFSMDEYLSFFKVAYDLKRSRFPEVVLLGSSVIDFEYYFTIRTLFNFHKVSYDECSSLLYVDRRGAPENTQMGLDLLKKLHLLQTLLRLSPKTGNDIVITETNWPITQTHPYAPTSEKECVTLQQQADYLVRYYLLALSSGVVKNVYWHQLIAPGYGLIDNRGDRLIKYPAFEAMKTMLHVLQGSTFLSLIKEGDVYRVSFMSQDETRIEALWCLSQATVSVDNRRVISRDGVDVITNKTLKVAGSVVYLIQQPSKQSKAS